MGVDTGGGVLAQVAAPAAAVAGFLPLLDNTDSQKDSDETVSVSKINMHVRSVFLPLK